MKAKLVRDHCPAVLDGECEPASTDAEYQMALLLKLHEEAQEIADDVTNSEEYADLLEVLLALADNNCVDGEDILEALVAKRALLGGFEEGQIWEEGGMQPPYPNVTLELDLVGGSCPPQHFQFRLSDEQIASKVLALPIWLRLVMERDG